MSLTAWLQAHLIELYTAHSNDQLQLILDSAFTPSAEIIVNHDKVSRDSLVDNLQFLQVSGPGTTLEWKHITEVPTDQSNPTAAGIVAGVILVDRMLKIRIRAAPARTRSSVTFTAKIIQDSSQQEDVNCDRRRIAHFVQSIVHEPMTIHLPHPHDPST